MNKHVVGHQLAQRQHFGGKEIGACQQDPMCPDEVRPCCRTLALRHRQQAVFVPNISLDTTVLMVKAAKRSRCDRAKKLGSAKPLNMRSNHPLMLLSCIVRS